MSESQFTRADWRPGGRRKTQPRVRDYPGQKTAPINFLAAGRLAGLNTPTAKRCTAIARKTGRVCRRVALKGTSLCLVHGGAWVAKKLRPYVPTKHGQRVMAERALGVDRPDRRKKTT
jgi:hypothetical protein